MMMMMRLWLSCHLLFAGISLNVFAATPEECELLVTPVSLADPSVILGKTNYLAGYTDYAPFKGILKATDSSWLNITESPSNITSEVLMSQENRINGTCVGSTVKMTLEGLRARVAFTEMDATLSVLPSCDGCFVFYINYTANDVKKLLEHINVSDKDLADQAQGRSLYLMGKQLTLSPSDLEHFRKQASCLGFLGEPDFLFNPEKSFCREGEGIRLPYSQ
ncbi:uncharacterized protein LOC112162528 [Oryzias melastigma]|uniref:Uncharacterized LOC112162528 n=1 Tax=Oryzias melastigma TaxID=30732 RepID=A0A3B3BX46_ORYME|nr:uncharacterized protein LOC112162528 [Oryzias melastigma]